LDGAGSDEGSTTSTEVLLLAVVGPFLSAVRVSIKALRSWSAVKALWELSLVVVGYHKMSIRMQNKGSRGSEVTHHYCVLAISIYAALDYG
jgi:hypothetical protein